MTTRFELTDEEALLLDGRCGAMTQSTIDSIKRRINFQATIEDPIIAKFVSKVVDYAKANGRLRFAKTHLRFCPVCQKSAGYVKFKSGPRRGLDNTDKPLHMYGVDLSDSYVHIRGHVSLGCCFDCYARATQHLVAALADVEAEIPEKITGKAPAFVRYKLRVCRQCGWEGSERLMEKKRTITGDGWYPAICPQCKAENRWLGMDIVKVAKGFEVYKLP